VPPTFVFLSPLERMAPATYASHSLISNAQPEATIAPICRLHPEILTQIFLSLQVGHSRLPTGAISYTPEWTRIMLVCRYFRHIALEMPILWTVLNSDARQEWTVLCLEHARSAPLRVRYKGGVGSEHLAAILNSRAIGGHDFSTHTLEIVNDARGVACPNITSLGWPISLHSLVCLELSSPEASLASLSSNPPSMPSLRYLKLVRTQVDWALKRVVWFLNNTPGLEEVFIQELSLESSTVSAYQAVSTQDIGKVALPALRILYILDTVDVAAAMLRLLPTPSVALGVVATPDKLYDVILEGCHAAILNGGLAFLRYTQGATCLEKGCMTIPTIGGGYIPEEAGTVEYGTLPHYTYLGRLPGCSFYLSFECIPVDTHPVLNGIETLRLSADFSEDLQTIDSFDSIGVAYLPRLRRLVLEMEPPCADLAWVREWIRRLGGRILDVQFGHRFSEDVIEQFASDMCQEGLFVSISRTPDPEPVKW
jgi:hypothetical protein